MPLAAADCAAFVIALASNVVLAWRDGVFRARARGVGHPGLVEREPAEVRHAERAQEQDGRNDRQFNREAAAIAGETPED